METTCGLIVGYVLNVEDCPIFCSNPATHMLLDKRSMNSLLICDNHAPNYVDIPAFQQFTKLR